MIGPPPDGNRLWIPSGHPADSYRSSRFLAGDIGGLALWGFVLVVLGWLCSGWVVVGAPVAAGRRRSPRRGGVVRGGGVCRAAAELSAAAVGVAARRRGLFGAVGVAARRRGCSGRWGLPRSGGVVRGGGGCRAAASWPGWRGGGAFGPAGPRRLRHASVGLRAGPGVRPAHQVGGASVCRPEVFAGCGRTAVGDLPIGGWGASACRRGVHGAGGTGALRSELGGSRCASGTCGAATGLRPVASCPSWRVTARLRGVRGCGSRRLAGNSGFCGLAGMPASGGCPRRRDLAWRAAPLSRARCPIPADLRLIPAYRGPIPAS
ncbi:hypothetical protein SAMN05443668_105532 [Cryptosporangium aurantiacum]|uniref:Uncharacterized protein n=1 Tax=Cryptosporangium aurantiacum TaxID=134849 RepID=A0A1M7QWU6_9ACTN|nr:hypothetical protein SAMN05443668_105532 [Cryptosporangium aurantiacum]